MEFLWEELLEGYNYAPHSRFENLKRALRWLAEGGIQTVGHISRESPSNPASVYAKIRSRRIETPFIVFDRGRLGIDSA